MNYALVVVAGLAMSLMLTPVAMSLGKRWGIVDRPGGRRMHLGSVPRSGGIVLIAAFAAAVGIAAWRGALTIGYSADDFTRLYGLLLGGAGAFLYGLLDDRFDFAPRVHLLFQLGVSIIALLTLIILERFTLPFIGYVELHAYSWGRWLSVLLTVFWVMGMMNTVNFLDGLNGLAGGVGAILCLVLAVHMHRVGQSSVALLPLALLGTLLGFLPYNFAGRIFLGGGAYFLGYALGALGLIAGGRVATVLLVMGLPIVDVAWQIFDRLRHRRALGQGDRGHLHYRLLDLGLSPRAIVFLYWGFCALFGVLALAVSSRVYKLLALGVVGLLVVAVLAWLSRDGRLPARR